MHVFFFTGINAQDLLIDNIKFTNISCTKPTKLIATQSLHAFFYTVRVTERMDCEIIGYG